MRVVGKLCFLGNLCLFSLCQANETVDEPTSPIPSPKIESLSNGDYKLSEITFSAKTREIRVPCQINMIEGLIEFAVVQEQGKTHESLLVTKVSPTHLNVVLKLLRYASSSKLYGLNSTDPQSARESAAISDSDHRKAWLSMDVEWTDGATKTRLPLAQLISNDHTKKSMDRMKWIYGGSLIEKGVFIAERTGDLACIYMSNGSLILYDGKGSHDDEIWVPMTKKLPPIGTSVTWIIYPDLESQSNKQ